MKLFTISAIFFLITALHFAQDLELELIADGFNSPLEIKHAGDDRLFIVEQGGQIKILNSDGSVNTTPFLNISSLVTSSGERGLLGLAFHPDYTTNGYFYVYYTDTGGNSQISRFSVSTNPDIADPNSEIQMLSFNQPYSNHNGGHIAFGPDGMLYIASGDGGSGGDPQNNSQKLSTLLGKLLRLDVDLPAPYIPADNPFIENSAAMDEIWAYGLRNPWKFSFDNQTGDLWIADVGQNAWEEINKVSATTAGLNYGWRCYEGNNAYNTTDCPPAGQLTFPVAVYAHQGGGCRSITGGYVYRGSEFPAIQGLYFFADLCTNEIGTVDPTGNLVFHGPFDATSITSFGTNPENNLYLTSFGNGGIYKIKDNTPLNIADTGQNPFLLYPNPATEEVSIESTNEALSQVVVYNLNGSVLISEKVDPAHATTISLTRFQSGVYFVDIITTKGNKQIKKLIIK